MAVEHGRAARRATSSASCSRAATSSPTRAVAGAALRGARIASASAAVALLRRGAGRARRPAHSGAAAARRRRGAQYAAKRRGGGQFCTAAGAAPGGGPRPAGSRRTSAGTRFAARPRPPLAVLDGSLRDARPLDRLEAVAMAFTGRPTPPSWACLVRPPGTRPDRVPVARRRPRHAAARPPRRGRRRDVLAGRLPRDRADHARGRRELRLPTADDPDADAAEASLLEEMDLDSVVGGRRPATFTASTWSSSTATPQSAPLEDAEQELSLLVRSGPAGHRGRARWSGAATTWRCELHHRRRWPSSPTRARSSRRPSTSSSGAFGCTVCTSCACASDRLELAAHASRLDLSFGWSQPASAGPDRPLPARAAPGGGRRRARRAGVPLLRGDREHPLRAQRPGAA